MTGSSLSTLTEVCLLTSGERNLIECCKDGGCQSTAVCNVICTEEASHGTEH